MDPRDHYTTTTAASFTRADFKLREGKPVYPYPYGSKPSGYVANFRPAQHYDPAVDTDPVMAPLCTPAEQFTTFNSRVSSTSLAKISWFVCFAHTLMTALCAA